MLGREKLFEELRRHLTKPTPDHMCVVGPPLFGKSVLLNHLASQFKVRNEYYVTSLYWDLRHGTPKTDDEFRHNFAKRVKTALEPTQPDLAEYLEIEDEELRDILHLVFDDMVSKDIRFLAVLDGFDHVLAGSGITRNLWDDMRVLGQKTSLRLVTGSRSRLRELCKSEDSRTSDFWEMFYDTPLQVGCFKKDDWSGFLAPVTSKGVQLQSSALKEFINWTGGVPVLAAALAERLLAGSRADESLSKSDIDLYAEELVEERQGLLAALWDDCSIELRSDLAQISKNVVSLTEVPDHRSRNLQLRGFARTSKNKLRSSCRLMSRFARQQADEVTNLQRLFGNGERFEQNIRSLLELRVAQVERADSELVSHVEYAIRDLRPDPAKSVIWMRSIAERALDVIWQKELPLDRSLPEDWKKSIWETQAFNSIEQLPRRRGQQCGILRIVTGTVEHAPVSKYVTKPTYLLLDHLQSVGDFGQHQDDNMISVSSAAAYCLSAISLCESLAQDLSNPKNTKTEIAT